MPLGRDVSGQRRRRRLRETRTQGAVHDRRTARHEPRRRLPRGDAEPVRREQLPRRRRPRGREAPTVAPIGSGIDPVAAEHAEPGELSMRRAHRLKGHQPVLGGDDAEVEDGAQSGRVRGGEAQLVAERHGQELRAPESMLQAHGRVVPERAHLRSQGRVRQVVVLREYPPQTQGVVLEQALLVVLRDRAHRSRQSTRREGRDAQRPRRDLPADGGLDDAGEGMSGIVSHL